MLNNDWTSECELWDEGSVREEEGNEEEQQQKERKALEEKEVEEEKEKEDEKEKKRRRRKMKELEEEEKGGDTSDSWHEKSYAMQPGWCNIEYDGHWYPDIQHKTENDIPETL